MTAESIVWGVMVGFFSMTLVVLIVGEMVVRVFDVFDQVDPRRFGPRPPWVGRLKRVVDFLLWAVPALFLLMVLRVWLARASA